MPGVNMVGNGPLRVSVVLTDKAAFLAEAHLHKALIADDDVLQAQKFLLIERRTARLADGTAPPLTTILWRPFSLDHVAGLRILQQKKRSRPREQVLRNCADDRARALLPVLRNKLIQRSRLEHERTEFRRTGKVVTDTMPGRILAGPCELEFGIDRVHI